jgi:hypothetical protein
VFAADAVARMTGKIGAAAVTAGPGVTNTVTAIKNAMMAQSPLILFGGATATLLKGRGSLQDIDLMAVMKPIVKWATTCMSVRSLAPSIERAIAIATDGVPGPVFVEVPVDLLYPESIVRMWYEKEAGMGKAKGIGAKALELYIKGHLYRQFRAPLMRCRVLTRIMARSCGGARVKGMYRLRFMPSGWFIAMKVGVAQASASLPRDKVTCAKPISNGASRAARGAWIHLLLLVTISIAPRSHYAVIVLRREKLCGQSA